MNNIVFFLINISIYSLPSKCYKIINPPSEVKNYINNLPTPTLEFTPAPTLEFTSEFAPTLDSAYEFTPTLDSAYEFTPTPTLDSAYEFTPTPTLEFTSASEFTPVSEFTPTSVSEFMTSTIIETTVSTSPTLVSKIIVDEILDLHNNERNIVNVTNFLNWSSKLELSANNLSKNLSERGCILEHSLANGVFGQNLYAAYGTTTPNFKNAVNAWIDEKFLINRPNITFSEIGHYLIMVSSRYNNVGCSAEINYDKRCYVVTCDYN